MSSFLDKDDLFFDLSDNRVKVGYWEWNIQTGETIFDERWASIVGYELKDLQPTSIDTWTNLTNPNDLEKSNIELHRHFNKEIDIYEAEARMKHKSGKWVWVLDRGRVTEFDKNGIPLKMVGSHYDITTRKYLEQLSLNQEYKKLLDSAPFPLLITTLKEGDIKYANTRAKKELDFDGLNLVGLNTEQYYVDPAIRKKFLELLNKNKYVSDFEVELYNYKHVKYWALISAQVIEFEGQTSLIIQINNITERKLLYKKLVNEEQKYRLLANSIVDVIFVFNASINSFQYFSPSIENLSGYSVVEALIINPNELFISDYALGFIKEFKDQNINTKSLNNIVNSKTIIEVQLKKKDGSIIWVELSSRIQINSQEEIEIVSVCRDINERKINEARIEYLYLHDYLTGMKNKVALHLLESDLKENKDINDNFTLILLDLDDFGNISREMGNQYADLVITQISQRIKDFVSFDEQTFHYESDEFVILINEHDEEKVYEYIKKLKSTIAQQILINGKIHLLTASFSYEIINKDSFKGDLIKNSKIALTVAKQSKNTIKQYNNEMSLSLTREAILENDLRYAIQNNELELYFQPIFNVKLGIIDQAEALLRWNHSKFGLVSPIEIIPIAEKTKLIIPITDWVIHETCSKLSKWNEDILGPLSISINLSFITIIERKEELYNFLKNELEISEINPKRLKLEITESSLVQDSHEVIKVFIRLRELGLSLALDDFGTGYSSFAYLKSIPLDIVKIDRSLIKSIENDQRSYKIVEAMISVLHGLELHVTIEGVENAKQYELLSNLKSDYIQGYLFSKPLKLNDFKLYYFSSKDKSSLPISELLFEKNPKNEIWKPEWSSGNDIIDKQHKELLVLISNIENIKENELNLDTFKLELDRFVRKVQIHFQEEVDILFKTGYAKAEYHKEIHENLKLNLEDISNKLNQNTYENIKTYISQLNLDLYKKHFLEEDVKFFSYVSNLSSKFPMNFISSKNFEDNKHFSQIQTIKEEYYYSINKILLDISVSFVRADIIEFSNLINSSLRKIGLKLEVDRVYIFKYDWINSTCSNTFEWCSEGISEQIDQLQDVQLSDIPEWVNAHVLGESIFIPNVDDLEPESNVRSILEPQGVISLLTLPMMDNNICYGFIGFDSVREKRIYSQNELNVLMNLSYILQSAIQKLSKQKLFN